MFDPRPDLGRPDAGLLAALRAEPVTSAAATDRRGPIARALVLALESADLAAIAALRRAEDQVRAAILQDFMILDLPNPIVGAFGSAATQRAEAVLRAVVDPAGLRAARTEQEPPSEAPRMLEHFTIRSVPYASKAFDLWGDA